MTYQVLLACPLSLSCHLVPKNGLVVPKFVMAEVSFCQKVCGASVLGAWVEGSISRKAWASVETIIPRAKITPSTSTSDFMFTKSQVNCITRSRSQMLDQSYECYNCGFKKRHGVYIPQNVDHRLKLSEWQPIARRIPVVVIGLIFWKTKCIFLDKINTEQESLYIYALGIHLDRSKTWSMFFW